MLSTNSLTAFSAATTTAPPQRPAAVRLVRDTQPVGAGGVQKQALPQNLPAIAPPRGSLLNLSV